MGVLEHPKQWTDGRGVQVTYTYDALDRMTGALYPDSTEDVTYLYDTNEQAAIEQCPFGIGRLCVRIDESGETVFAYDVYGNVVTQTYTTESGDIYVTQYEYDAGHRLLAVIDPTGRRTAVERDAVRRIETVRTTLDGVMSDAGDEHRVPSGRGDDG